jgi:hypothetical protein
MIANNTTMAKNNDAFAMRGAGVWREVSLLYPEDFTAFMCVSFTLFATAIYSYNLNVYIGIEAEKYKADQSRDCWFNVEQDWGQPWCQKNL